MMKTQPKIVQTSTQKTAIVSVTCPRSEIQDVMGPGIQEVYAALQAQNIKPTGPWFSHHPLMDPNIFECGTTVPVADIVKPVGLAN